MAQAKEMTSGASFPLILNFTLPLLLGNLLQQTYSLMDAAIVGKYLGINALASVGASTSVVFLILGFCTGCCSGFSIPVAQKFGARDYVTMRRFISVSLKISGVMSVALAIITSLLCAYILRTMQTPENIFDGAYTYLLITFIGIPSIFFYNLLSGIIRALGDSKTPFWFLLLSSVLNIILDLFCIIVLGWGVAGAAIATVFSQGVSSVLCYIYMNRKYEILKTTPSERRFRSDIARQLLGIGVPMGLQFSITAIGSIMLQSANNALGTACVAAFTAAMRIKMFFMCALDSLGIAMATYSGQELRSRKAHSHLARNQVVVRYDACLRSSDKHNNMVLCREIRPAVYRPIRGGSHKRYGVVFTYQLVVLSIARFAHYFTLHHSGGRLHQTGYVLWRIRNDSPYYGQSCSSAVVRLFRCMLW